MERDFRLTGEKRKQSDSPVADEAFKTSSLWKVSITRTRALVVDMTNWKQIHKAY